jgi:two-component system cell cycle response regulator CpdR
MHLEHLMARPRALVADDHDDLLEVVSHVIDQLGIDVVRASCGAELLDRLAHDGPFDVVVTDVAMPWMTGLHAVHSARAAGSICPVIVMTALRDQRTATQIETLGADVRLLLKPFTMIELKAAVLESLGTAASEPPGPLPG